MGHGPICITAFVGLPEMYLWSRFEESFPCGCVTHLYDITRRAFAHNMASVIALF